MMICPTKICTGDMWKVDFGSLPVLEQTADTIGEDEVAWDFSNVRSYIKKGKTFLVIRAPDPKKYSSHMVVFCDGEDLVVPITKSKNCWFRSTLVMASGPSAGAIWTEIGG